MTRMNLHELMRIQEPSRIAIVGAGGKTSTIWRLADSLPGKVVITTTTHMGVDQVSRADVCLFPEPELDLRDLEWGRLDRVICITGPVVDGHRLSSLSKPQIDQLLQLSNELEFTILVEADGSRMLPLKAPAAHEPVIPEWVDTVIVVAGVSALGKPLNENNVFRPEIFSKLSGISINAEITPEGLEKVLINPEGGIKGIPKKARRILVLNQAEDISKFPNKMRIARKCQNHYDSVLIASLGARNPNPLVHARVEQIGAIILAAGGSFRMQGNAKQVLEFNGETLVGRAARIARQAGFSPVIVVTGFEAESVSSILADTDVEIASNDHWMEGQSTSIRAGLNQLGDRCNAAIFMLVDQPFVTVELITELRDSYQTNFTPIVAPMVDDQRANPVIFDRVTFEELNNLEGDTGGRAIMGHFEHTWLPWMDRRILLDIDTQEDLERVKHAINGHL